MDISLILFLAAGIVAAVETVRTRSLVAAAIALLAFAHIGF